MAEELRRENDERTGEEEARLADDLSLLQSALVGAEEKYKRVLADFQNYQRRALQNEAFARRQGAAEVVASLIPVLDHFDYALKQECQGAERAGVLEGLRLIRDEFLKVLGAHEVRTISPEPGEEFTPGTHEAVMQQVAEGIEPGRIVCTFQVGYMLGERVLRPAKVSIAADGSGGS